MKAEAKAKQLLNAAGILVYDPGQAIGECKAPYAVVRCAGNYQTIASRRLTYTLMMIHCYVPLDGTQNSALATLSDAVKAAMRAMKRQAMPTGREDPDLIAIDYKALTRAIEYQVLKAQKE